MAPNSPVMSNFRNLASVFNILLLRLTHLWKRTLPIIICLTPSFSSLHHCHRHLDGDLNVLLAEVGDVHVGDNLLPPLLLLRTLYPASLCHVTSMLATTCLSLIFPPLKEACTQSQHKTNAQVLWKRCEHHDVRGATGRRMSVWIDSGAGAPLVHHYCGRVAPKTNLTNTTNKYYKYNTNTNTNITNMWIDSGGGGTTTALKHYYCGRVAPKTDSTD